MSTDHNPELKAQTKKHDNNSTTLRVFMLKTDKLFENGLKITMLFQKEHG
jgi:hypothetical protein